MTSPKPDKARSQSKSMQTSEVAVPTFEASSRIAYGDICQGSMVDEIKTSLCHMDKQIEQPVDHCQWCTRTPCHNEGILSLVITLSSPKLPTLHCLHSQGSRYWKTLQIEPHSWGQKTYYVLWWSRLIGRTKWGWNSSRQEHIYVLEIHSQLQMT